MLFRYTCSQMICFVFAISALGQTFQNGVAQVSSVSALNAALSEPSINRVELAPGRYELAAALAITRSMVLWAEPGTVVIDALQPQEYTGTYRHALTVSLQSNDVVELVGLRITGASTQVSGAGLRTSGGHVVIRRCVIAGNYCINVNGCGLYTENGMLTMEESEIYNNTAQQGGGAGLTVWSSQVTIRDSRIFSNTVFGVRLGSGCGGVLVFGSAVVSIVRSFIFSNTDQEGVSNLKIYNRYAPTVCTVETTLVVVDTGCGSYGCGSISPCSSPPPSIPPPSVPPSPDLPPPLPPLLPPVPPSVVTVEAGGSIVIGRSGALVIGGANIHERESL